MTLSRIVSSLLACLALAACQPQEATETATQKTPHHSPFASVMVDSVNYLHDRGMGYTLYDISGTDKKPVGGSIVDPLGSGGAKECCFKLPRVWHPGIKLRVEWQDSDFERTHPEKYAQDLELPRYDRPADVYVVFYPEHKVEVFVSPAEPGHPEWAGRIKETPWDLCVAQYGQKICKRAIPKAGLSPKELTALCDDYHLEKYPDADDRCQKLINECIDKFDDEEMCAKITKGPRKKYDYAQCLRDTQDESLCSWRFPGERQR